MKLATVKVVALAAISSLALAACQGIEPAAEESAISEQTVRIMVDSDSAEQRVVAEIYRATLESEGHDAEILRNQQLTPDERAELLSHGEADMWIGCTGNLLEAFDSNRAAELSTEYVEDQADPSGTDYLAETHIAMMAALPVELTTVDPSSARGCEGDSHVELPQNYVPIYVKGLLDRDERLTVSSVTKYLTTQEISDLVEEAEATGNEQDIVAKWLSQIVSTGDIGAESDSDSSNSAGE
ncbi:hypothetical protein [Corynebacterium endometrii]|uniref:ABC-type glycine betaine transport system substrate-binding domain-containing protein n=1 Tax=Corynebacterium endometrii TaxID=2488819 RepID=A0A4P7QFL1_9CORY|nr:hypothetical protein [Corynebacterium endometrii]QCB28190.1 hypothetical protein CENDO_04500 [Corynebacterium endometrii]